jgi:antitoxin component YwqK of YwqJK toxin-antitoxin module
MKIEIRREYYKHEKIWYEWSYLNNIMYGIQKCYYENGQLCREWYVTFQQMHSIYKFWHPDGSKDFIQQLKNSKINGLKITFKYKTKSLLNN